MSDRNVRVSVRILEKEYQVACLPEERSELLDSAEFLNNKMKEIRDGGNIVGLDRIAVGRLAQKALHIGLAGQKPDFADEDIF